MTARAQNLTAGIAYLVGILCLFLTAPHNGEFWWSDAPRHALNGVFVKDLIAAMPSDPKTWAMQYYIKYPALTILFYPPMFYAISAPFFAFFGVSHTTAVAVVLLHYFALAFGLYLVARMWLGPLPSFAVGLAALAAPEIALWGRQVMLDVPATAFATWGILAALHYLRSGRPWLIYIAVLLLLCATYTKINAAFLFVPLAAAIVYKRNLGAFRDSHLWLATLLCMIGMVPAIILTLKFGAANVQSVVSADVGVHEAGLFAPWLWYGRRLPEMVGWPFVLMIMTIPLLWLSGRRLGVAPSEAILLTGWFLIGYSLLSIIELKATRNAVIILPPVLLAAGLTWCAWLGKARWAEVALVAVALAATGAVLLFKPVPKVTGYRQAAAWIAEHAPPDAIVVFSGERDGSYIWNMRTMEQRKDITTVRSDKLFLSISVERARGTKSKSLSEDQIASLLDNDGVTYVVAQDDFWTDIPVMARLQALLRSPHFHEVQRITIASNVPVHDKMLRIYRNDGEINPHPRGISLDLLMINQQVSGTLKQPH
jgi:hypothetical protein